jgi:hypothetical protein
MDFTYLEGVMAGLAIIVIGSFADRLTGHMFRAPQARSTERPRRQSQRLYILKGKVDPDAEYY